MLLNDTRGSLGMFSRAGRNSTDKYHILTRKDEILSGMNKKMKLPDLFTPEEIIKNTEEDDDNIDIFKTEENEMGKVIKKRGDKLDRNHKGIKQMKQKPKSEITKYLEMKKKVKKKAENPSCTKYNPKHEYVWKKTVYPGPLWGQSIRKNHSILPKEEVDAKFYQSHTDFQIKGKNFVDLARQTRRASFTGAKNLRGKLVKSSHSPIRESHSISFNKGKTSSDFYSTKSKFPVSKKESVSNFHIMTGSSEQSENYFGFKKRRSGSSDYRENTNFNNSNPTGTNRWIKIQAPDFKKIISREQLEKIYGDKRTIIPFSFPNFKWTRPSKVIIKVLNTFK